jgi:hypothetical protein
MPITSNLFEAYLKCPTKCFLRSRGETGTENSYANWVRAQQLRRTALRQQIRLEVDSRQQSERPWGVPEVPEPESTVGPQNVSEMSGLWVADRFHKGRDRLGRKQIE